MPFPPISLDDAQKKLLATELQRVVDYLNAGSAGATATPINWQALIAALLPIILQLLAAFGGG
jgi:hypothetical protein